MPYDRYKLTLSGADDSAHTTGIESVEIWFEAAADSMGFNGEQETKLGGVANNSIDFGDGWRVRHVPTVMKPGAGVGTTSRSISR